MEPVEIGPNLLGRLVADEQGDRKDNKDAEQMIEEPSNEPSSRGSGLR